MKVTQLKPLSTSYPFNTEINALTKAEEKMIYYSRNIEDNKTLYTNFDNDFNTYLSKLSKSHLTSCVSQLNDRKIIYVGVSQVQFVGNLGKASVTNDYLNGVVLESAEFEINTTTGETPNMDRCVLASYYLFNLGCTIINYENIKKNFQLNDLIIQYLVKLFSKILKLNDINNDLLKAVVSLFYYMFLLEMKYTSALAVTLSNHVENSDEISQLLKNKSLDRYTKFRDILNAFIDFNFTYSAPNKLISDIISQLKISGFLRITSRIDHMISTIILANYGFDTIFNISSKLQEEIENIYYNQYGQHIRFNTDNLK